MKINFATTYNKMPRDYRLSMLLDALPVNLEDLSDDFLRYDTSYLDGGEEKQFKLPESGRYVLLLLQAGSGRGQLWTTLRSRPPQGNDRLAYYKEHVGEVVECEVTG